MVEHRADLIAGYFNRGNGYQDNQGDKHGVLHEILPAVVAGETPKPVDNSHDQPPNTSDAV
jgi:hypothetical protein